MYKRQHINRPAYGARYTAETFQACQAALLCFGAKAAQRHARPCRNKEFLPVLHDGEFPGQAAKVDDCTVIALISKQRIGPIAQKVRPHCMVAAAGEQIPQLRGILRLAPESGGAADPECGVPRQRFLWRKGNCDLCKIVLKSSCLLLLHGSSPCAQPNVRAVAQIELSNAAAPITPASLRSSQARISGTRPPVMSCVSFCT